MQRYIADRRILSQPTLFFFFLIVRIRSNLHKAQAIKVDETGKPEAEKTFFQKYWYVLNHIFIISFSSPLWYCS